MCVWMHMSLDFRLSPARTFLAGDLNRQGPKVAAIWLNSQTLASPLKKTITRSGNYSVRVPTKKGPEVYDYIPRAQAGVLE
jgi:hypothetical protein